MTLRVAHSPLSGRIYCGHVRPGGQVWSGQKTDVTSDVLGAIIEKAKAEGELEVTVNGEPRHLIKVLDLPSKSESNAAVAAILFALEDDEGMAFLRYWNEGEFDRCRSGWPEAPEEVYIGADPLYKPPPPPSPT